MKKKTNTGKTTKARKVIDPKVLDQLLADYGRRPQDIVGENGLLKQLTKAVVERAMQAELTDHLGYEKHDPAGYHTGNSRNGTSRKKLIGDFGELEVETPRDRNGSFEPKIVGKHQTHWTGFDDRAQHKAYSWCSGPSAVRGAPLPVSSFSFSQLRVNFGLTTGGKLLGFRC